MQTIAINAESRVNSSEHLFRNLRNARLALLEGGHSQSNADHIMRGTCARYLADLAVGSVQGARVERTLIDLAMDEEFARRGLLPSPTRAAASPPAGKAQPPEAALPPADFSLPLDWTVFGVDVRLLLVIVAMLAVYALVPGPAVP